MFRLLSKYSLLVTTLLHKTFGFCYISTRTCHSHHRRSSQVWRLEGFTWNRRSVCRKEKSGVPVELKRMRNRLMIVPLANFASQQPVHFLGCHGAAQNQSLSGAAGSFRLVCLGLFPSQDSCRRLPDRPENDPAGSVVAPPDMFGAIDKI
ncbi:hypothetical protein E2C01_045043 [Portunus trituberculatus]|uniref:Secreted protein n=1 Tax=Portunus trituberculatus TaxID=210409 RepID=A0A5B7FX72_PORTR|nr:hypothetical protein [Portunus trituberculatus]